MEIEPGFLDALKIVGKTKNKDVVEKAQIFENLFLLFYLICSTGEFTDKIEKSNIHIRQMFITFAKQYHISNPAKAFDSILNIEMIKCKLLAAYRNKCETEIPRLEGELEKTKKEAEANYIVLARTMNNLQKYEEADLWITVPEACEVIKDMINSSLVPVDKPKCDFNTLRKRIQTYLNKKNCERIKNGGRKGNYYKYIDVARAAEEYYRSFTAKQYETEFTMAAKKRDDI